MPRAELFVPRNTPLASKELAMHTTVVTAGAPRPSRRGLLAGVALVVSAFVSACAPRAGSGGTAAEQASQQVGPAKISFWIWGTPEYKDRAEAVAKQFQAKFPRIEVEVIQHSEGFQDKLLAAFVGGTPPDTFVLDMQVTPAYGKRDVLVNLNELLKTDRSFPVNELNELAVRIMSYQGALLGLPSEAGPNLFYYNADAFRKAGLKTPYELWRADQWTWEAFVQGLKAVTRVNATGQFEFAGAATGLHRLWINANGGKEFDDWQKPTRCLYDTPEAIEAFQFLQDLRFQHKVTPVNFTAEMGMNDTQAFAAGRVAMMARWTTGIGVYREIKDFTWGMVPYPKRKNYANDHATSGLAIAKDTKARAAAWEWVKFHAGPEGQKIVAGFSPYSVYFNPEARRIAMENWKSIPTLETPTVPEELIIGGKYSFIRLVSPDEARINRIISDGMRDFWAGKEGARQMAERVAAEVNAFLQQNPQ
jgi:multiple sugar transport system substrate-binding protein